MPQRAAQSTLRIFSSRKTLETGAVALTVNYTICRGIYQYHMRSYVVSVRKHSLIPHSMNLIGFWCAESVRHNSPAGMLRACGTCHFDSTPDETSGQDAEKGSSDGHYFGISEYDDSTKDLPERMFLVNRRPPLVLQSAAADLSFFLRWVFAEPQ